MADNGIIKASFDARTCLEQMKRLSTDEKQNRKALSSATRKALTPIKKEARQGFKKYKNRFIVKKGQRFGSQRPFKGSKLAKFCRVKTFFNAKKKWKGGYVTIKSNKKWPESNLLRLFETGTKRNQSLVMSAGWFFEKATRSKQQEANQILEREIKAWIQSRQI